MIEERLAARGILVSHETVRQWGLKFGQDVANAIRRRLPRPSDKWHLDEVVIKIADKKHCHRLTATEYRTARDQAFATWRAVTGLAQAA